MIHSSTAVVGEADRELSCTRMMCVWCFGCLVERPRWASIRVRVDIHTMLPCFFISLSPCGSCCLGDSCYERTIRDTRCVIVVCGAIRVVSALTW